MELEPRPIYSQREGENDQQYAWFRQYYELGDTRTLPRAAMRCGVSRSLVERAAREHDWDIRSQQLDRDASHVAKTMIRDEDEALALQYAVGHVMIRMGMTALQAKNPALLDMKTVTALIQQGVEHTRRGAGAADMVISLDQRRSIQQQFADFLGEEIDGD